MVCAVTTARKPSSRRGTGRKPAAESESPSRWKPDEQMVHAILAGTGPKMAVLPAADRCWVVAALSLAGLSAEEIADRMACSLRQVRVVRALDMYQMASLTQTETKTFTDEVRLLRSELTAANQRIAELDSEASRVKIQRDNLIDAHMVGAKVCGRCGEPKTGYNLWVDPKTGKEHCRGCHRRRQQSYRDQKKPVEMSPEIVLTAVSTMKSI